jgi:hypothetical protein
MAAYTTIDDPSEYFQTLVYAGTGGLNVPVTHTNTGNSDLQPDFIWFKDRGAGYSHALYDSNRGRAKVVYSDSTVAEASSGVNDDLVSFDSDGFKVGSPSNANSTNGGTTSKVAYQWKSNGGTTASNSDGDLTSTTQFNSTAMFSIITYTGKDPIEPLDIGHGMGVVPDVYIVKNRDRSANWGVYHKNLTSPAENRNLKLNLANAEAAESTFWRNEAPTTTIIKTGENASVNVANEKFIVYAWKSVQGFSKFSSYEGNGEATNGPFVFTGFSPAWVMIKNIETANRPWYIFDNQRRTFNPNGTIFKANTGDAEATDQAIDMLSNGFKIRPDALGSFGTSTLNHSGQTMVYLAFAHHPQVTSTGIPTTAR